ncbi:MAG: energy transducer TonB [Prevotella sp.]|nr:energy transducer TonB [Prevotella sp.]
MNKLIVTALLAMMSAGMKAQVAQDTACVDVKTMVGKNDKLPQFRSGVNDLVRYLSFNVKYPKEAKKAGVEGRVVTVFVVEADGSISNVQPVQSLVHFKNKEKTLKDTGKTEQELTNHFGNLFQDEAKRVISTMPKWTPGVQDGKKVRVKYSCPITFAQP